MERREEEYQRIRISEERRLSEVMCCSNRCRELQMCMHTYTQHVWNEDVY